jgi:riboflavin-specific deaminase-like protein
MCALTISIALCCPVATLGHGNDRLHSAASPRALDYVTLERLLPDRATVTPEEAYGSLGLVERAPAARPYTIANMVATADGRATLDGRTEGISSETDRDLFHALRTQVDAVMVGTGTIALERYGPLARRAEVRRRRAELGLPEAPLAVTASRTLELPADAPLLADPGSRIVVLTNSDREPPACAAELVVERLPGPELDLTAGVERLRTVHGVRAMLHEGGPTLLAAMLAAGLVDELFLTVSPLLVGGGEPSVVEGTAFERPRGMQLQSVLSHESYLYLRYALR